MHAVMISTCDDAGLCQDDSVLGEIQCIKNMTGKHPQNAPWESRNGYIPPPRFQQLRALDNLQQQQQQFVPGSLNMSPSHSRSPSLFTFLRSKNATNAQISPASQKIQPAQASASTLSAPTTQEPLTMSYDQQKPQRGQHLHLSQPSSIPFNRSQAQPRPQSQPQPRTASPSMAPDPNPQQSGPAPSTQATPSTQETSQPPASTPNPVHPEIRSVVQLTVAHARKVYFSGPLIRRLERQADGQKPHKDDGWVEIWAQLSGTNLSIWDMKEIQEASKQGTEVPPSYISVTDAVRILHH